MTFAGVLRGPFTIAGLAAPLVLLGCAPRVAREEAPSRAAPTELRVAERWYQRTRNLEDSIDVRRAGASDADERGWPLAERERRYRASRDSLVTHLTSLDPAGLGAEDRRALDVMRRTVANELVPSPWADAATPADAAGCAYDAAALAARDTAALRARVYDCYGRAARRILFRGDTLDRLTILATLARTSDAARRRELFLALEPVWRSVNGDDGPSSPWRLLVRRSAPGWLGDASPVAAASRALGLEPAVMERWLVSILERWRDLTLDTGTLEPWDYHYAMGAASRALGARVPLERLRAINDSFYASLGASPAALRVHYDLTPRAGKTPVAYTTFGGRGGWEADAWSRPVPWVFATYRVGGLDNLNELLHETGHAVHIAAIRTRPAFMDWPDSDPYTEALGDLVALEAYEPAWQARWLGDSVPLSVALRARYGGIVLDIAWALFEVRMYAHPEADPNATWSALTREYLHVAPHPELSWWAMRGQLVDSPGYMMNYAIGAIVAADLRARMRELCGVATMPNAGWYACVSDRLYRFGLERPSRAVIEDFLGRPISPDALSSDLARMGPAR